MSWTRGTPWRRGTFDAPGATVEGLIHVPKRRDEDEKSRQLRHMTEERDDLALALEASKRREAALAAEVAALRTEPRSDEAASWKRKAEMHARNCLILSDRLEQMRRENQRLETELRASRGDRAALAQLAKEGR